MRIGVQGVAAQPSRYFCVEAKMKLNVGRIQDAPPPFIRPEFDAVFIQAVVVKHAAIKEQTKGGQVGQGLACRPELLREMRVVALEVGHNCDRSVSESDFICCLH